jgi:hypothetical protein
VYLDAPRRPADGRDPVAAHEGHRLQIANRAERIVESIPQRCRDSSESLLKVSHEKGRAVGRLYIPMFSKPGAKNFNHYNLVAPTGSGSQANLLEIALEGLALAA